MLTGRLGTLVKGASRTGSSLAAMKAALARRGIIATGVCRAPFRACTPEEARAADEIVASAEAALL
jgi:dihydrodipicolinate synthase/N-acetylneuraminate lyase